ncbi:MAG: hypothetical protein M1422_07510 [Candidatus Thermoplasmatota archaeon]|nr:hypothetical protein [Candidatus Thermoplasmatota archaeon]MCL5252921.1 hypothetical protein [Candidatus Thermoplasmatota archaeon]
MPETGQYGSTRGFRVTPELYSINEERPHSSLEYMTPSEYRKSAEKPVEVKRKAMQ